MLIDTVKYSETLKKLWSDTFGDDEEYINLLFDNGCKPAECFAEVYEGKVISVLYLLRGYIINGDQKLEGRYLYAAATDMNHRGKGLMAKLIREAQEYVKRNNISFISLVPADEGLYGYYVRFGFEPLMKNYVATVGGANKAVLKSEIAPEDAFELRKCIGVPYFHFADEEWKYAVSCLEYAGYRFLKISDDSYCIISDDGADVLEYVSAAEGVSENTNKLIYALNEGTTVVSPYDLSEHSECVENKFGMVFFADENIKDDFESGIYMNIALD